MSSNNTELDSILAVLQAHDVAEAEFFDGKLAKIKFHPPKPAEDKFSRNQKEDMERALFYSAG